MQCSTSPLPPGEPGPKSPLQTPPSPRSSPPQDPEKSASPTNDRPPSPEPNCAICLGKSRNKSFTDSCLHQFCFTCLLEWSRVSSRSRQCHYYINNRHIWTSRYHLLILFLTYSFSSCHFARSIPITLYFNFQLG